MTAKLTDKQFQQKNFKCSSVLTVVLRDFLTFSHVCVDAHVACCPSQTLVLPVGDVFFGLRVYVLFGQTKVDDMDGVLPLASWPSNKEVFWFHISVYQTLGVDVLHPCYLEARQKN